MTIRSLALRLLRYIGVTNLSPLANEASLLQRGLEENDLAEVATCITAALQEAFTDAPSSLSEYPLGEVLRPPTSINLTATQYEKLATSVTGYEPWMQGCTVRISGDDLDNRIVATSEVTGDVLTKVSETNEHGSESIVVLHLIGTPDPQIGDILVSEGLEMLITSLGASFPPDDPVTQDYRQSYNVSANTSVLSDLTDQPVYLKTQGLTTAVSLMRPYMGGSGAVSGMVYADAIPLPANVRSVIEPIELPNNPRLPMANSAEQFRYWNGASSGHGFPHPFAPSSSYGLTNKQVGEPAVAFADTHYDPTSPHLPTFLRFSPMPDRAYPVTFKVKVKPPVITLEMIDTGDHTTDPGIAIPVDWVESIVLPYALRRWIAHPNFSAELSQIDEIRFQYKKAKEALEGMKPLVSRTAAIYAN